VAELLKAPDADEITETLKELHFATVKRLDQQLSSLIAFVPDDAIVVVSGDHGEEFDRGWLEPRDSMTNASGSRFSPAISTSRTLGFGTSI